jgi:hypothetical protein
MLRKAIVAISILLLTTGVVSAQLPTPSLHLNNDKPPRTKEQKENDKAYSEYQSTLKKIPDAGKKDPWADVRPTPPAAAKNKQQ